MLTKQNFVFAGQPESKVIVIAKAEGRVESAHATYQVRSSNQVLEPYRMHAYHRVRAKHVPEGIWDHTNALAMLLARKLKSVIFMCGLFMNQGVCNAKRHTGP